MANPEHLEILKHGSNAWGEWRRKNPHVEPNLFKANLRFANLSHVDLNHAQLNNIKLVKADLSHANFSHADLSYADLSDANLSHANLSHANLREANLSYSDLNNATLTRANLREANLNCATLNGTDLSNAYIGWNIFGNNDLRNLKGLDTVLYLGPSTIGVDTLYKSNGEIPDEFLIGCGLPENFVPFVQSHVGAEQAIQFHSCFISYSHKDEDFARRLYSRMRDAHLRVWFAPEEMKGGRKLHEQIFSAIQLHDKLLLVLSEHSLQSEWVTTELRRARKVEREETRRKLFPIRLTDFDAIQKWECFDGESGKDLGIELREYFIPDFSNWKDHDSFEKAFDRLLRDLKAEE